MIKSTFGAAAAVAVLIGSAAIAADDAASTSDLRVVRDPETGTLRAPTPEEQRALVAKEKAEKQVGPADVALRTLRDGTRAATLPMSYLTSITVTRDADGKLVFTHSDPALDAPSTQREEQ